MAPAGDDKDQRIRRLQEEWLRASGTRASDVAKPSFVDKTLAAVAPVLLATSVIGLVVLYGQHQQVRSELFHLQQDFVEFRKPGDRFTAADGARLEKRIESIERNERDFEIEYQRHESWGREWVRTAERRLRDLERALGRDGYWGDDKRE